MRPATFAITACLLAGAIVAWLAGCGPSPEKPADVVHAYFRYLARDPLRTLPLLAPAFHRDHDLRLASTTEARAFLRDGPVRPLPERPPESPELALHHRQLTWLAVQQREEFRRLAAKLRLGEVRPLPPVAQDRVQLAVEVRIPPMPPFQQIFELRRDTPGAAWRIERIRQQGVTRANRVAAFIAHPTERTREALAAALPRADTP